MIHTSELLAVALFLGLVVATYAAEVRLLWRLARKRPVERGLWRHRWVRVATHCCAGLGTCCIAYGWLWESNALQLTRPRVAVAGWPAAAPPLAILHVTDTHLEGRDRRVRLALEHAAAVTPQLVCWTGDYLNDRGSLALLEEMGRTIRGAAGAFAVGGNWDRAGPDDRGLDALAQAGVRVLRDERVAVAVQGTTVQVVGIDYPAQRGWERLVTEAPPGDPVVFLYHSPDLVEKLAALHRPALYLCGHTHGGQVRLPLYGALITLAHHGKRYEMGAYDVGAVSLYLSRGIGMEGGPMPRVRFWCRPELPLITVVPR